MASLNIVQDGVEKASKVSPRQGKWATPKEIDIKTNPKQSPLQQTLTQLVKDSRIEKKAGQLLYRPQQGAGPGGVGKGTRIKPRGKPDRPDPRRNKPDGKKPDRPDRNDGKKPDRPDRNEGKKPSDRDDRAERERERKRDSQRRDNVAKTVTRGAIGQGVRQSTTRTITNSILY